MNCFDINNYLQRFNEILSNMSCKMLSKCPECSITLHFIECMISHHQSAIYMCDNLLKYTNCEELQNISNNMIEMQYNEIKKMQNIACTTSCLKNTTYDIKKYYYKYKVDVCDMIYKMRMAPRCNSVNLNFLNEMITHHKGAIELCENLLKFPIDCRLKELVKNMISEQEMDIRELKEIKNMLCK